MTCFRLKISFGLPKFLRSSNRQNRGKKIDENTEDYVDFHWRFLDPAADRETRTTELDQLPGLSDYQKILRFFLSQEEAEAAEDIAGSEDAGDEDMAMLKSKMMPSDEWRIRPKCERTTAQLPTSGRAETVQQNEEDEQFRDVSKFLSGMHHDCPSCSQLPGGGDDLLHYACVDVTGPIRRQMRPSEAATNGVAAPAATAAGFRPIAVAGRSDSRVSNLSFEKMRGGAAASGWEVTRRPQIRTRASSWV
jgi:uncharacterized protein YbdZ (MbtH family)